MQAVKPEEVDEEVPVATPALETIEQIPDAHTAGPSGAATMETLRKRTPRKLDSSGENSLSGSEDEL